MRIPALCLLGLLSGLCASGRPCAAKQESWAASAGSFPLFRTWKPRGELRSVPMALVKSDESAIVLRKIDGSEIRVPWAKLTSSDRRFVRRARTGTRLAGTDPEVTRRIKAACRVASGLTIDGKADDWLGLPIQLSAAADNGVPGGLDIVHMAIAPREDDLLLLIATRSKPTIGPNALQLFIDLLGQHEWDLRILLRANGSHRLRVFDETRGSRQVAEVTMKGVPLEVGDVLELAIPYAVLVPLLPETLRPALSGANARPWIRVSAVTWDASRGARADRSSALASYRLQPAKIRLDAEVPGSVSGDLAISVPFDGRLLVGNGAQGLRGHVGQYAYDLYGRDHAFDPARNHNSKVNADYYSWDLPLLSPVAGEIGSVRGHYPDATPLEKQRLPGNLVVIYPRGSKTRRIYLGHCKQSSIEVERGQAVREGQPLARIGNSGQSGWPHLHLALLDRASGATLPLAFDHVIVALNVAVDDPWAREVRAWTIRAGVFVERP